MITTPVEQLSAPRATTPPSAGSYWFNVELAKQHPGCLEYIVVHEIAHYFERNHGERFTTLVDRLLPDWRSRRDQLNGTPLADET